MNTFGKAPTGCCLIVLCAVASGCAGGTGCFGLCPPPGVNLPEPSRVVLEGEACAGMDNFERCARAIEVQKLPLTANRVTRSGERLCLLLESGGNKCLEPDANETERSVSYAYLGSLPKPPFHVIWTQHYEGNSILLIHAQSGKTHFVDDVPIPSPDGRRLAVASLDLEAQYNSNSLEILRADDDQLVSEWRLEAEGWGPGSPTWQAPGRVSFPQMVLGDVAERHPSEIGTWQLTRKRGAWTGKPLL